RHIYDLHSFPTRRSSDLFLVQTDKKDVGFEFEKREPKTKKERKPKEPVAKIDFTGKESLGKCPKCGGKIFAREIDFGDRFLGLRSEEHTSELQSRFDLVC